MEKFKVIRNDYSKIEEIDNAKFNSHFRILVAYNAGGYNKNDDYNYDRGYYLAVIPVTQYENLEFRNLNLSWKKLILKTNRKTKAKDKEAIEISYKEQIELIDEILERASNQLI